MERLFTSDGGVGIWGHVARPRSAPGTWTPGVVLYHGFPPGRGSGRLSARSFPELADRIATELGWVVLVITFRGCGDSEGDFSLGGWLADARAASDHLHDVERRQRGVDGRVRHRRRAGRVRGGGRPPGAGRGGHGLAGRLRRLGPQPPSPAAARP